MKGSRLTIPARFIDLLFHDDGFFREVSQLKKADSGSFPKYDQWYDQEGLHMQFALAGYSSGDVQVRVHVPSNELVIESQGLEPPANVKPDGETGEEKEAKTEIQKGMIVRGIARRKFRTRFLISPELDISKTAAIMSHGLLKILIPPLLEGVDSVLVEVSEK